MNAQPNPGMQVTAFDNPMGIDHQFIYGNSLIDAVILQLGLTGSY